MVEIGDNGNDTENNDEDIDIIKIHNVSSFCVYFKVKVWLLLLLFWCNDWDGEIWLGGRETVTTMTTVVMNTNCSETYRLGLIKWKKAPRVV